MRKSLIWTKASSYRCISWIKSINIFGLMKHDYNNMAYVSTPPTPKSSPGNISYKILLLAYKALNDLSPAYLTNLLSRYNPTRSLRSQNSGLLVVPRIAKSTKGGRTFSYLTPKFWNSLPDNVRGSDTLSLFKSRLKTHLFSQAFI